MDGNAHPERKEVIAHLHSRRIEGRPVVYPMHVLPLYIKLCEGQSFPVADRISRWGINLPTSADLTHDDVRYVCDSLAECLVASSVR